MRRGIRSLLSVALFSSLSVALAAPAMAQQPSDPDGIWTLQDENSSIATSKLKDKYYVNGLRLGYTSATDTLPASLANFDNWMWGPGRSRWSLDLSQAMYTPADVQLIPPDPHDRPYAGVLTGTFSLQHDSDSSRSVLGVQAGLVGPDALAKQMQNGFHGLIGHGASKGWDFQIHDEPVVDLLATKIWRVPLWRDGVQVDVLPEVTGGAGNLRVYGLAGSVLRIGQGLDSDYGVARVNPGLSGTDVYAPTRNLVWYFFIGADGQAVAHDITIDGNTFQSSASADRQPFVGEFEAGLAVILGRVRLSYTQVIQTEEIKGQQGGPHQFGSLALSVRY
ncbi:MAG: lipid A deacylase LpxR family protein [Stellaceae bacterium]